MKRIWKPVSYFFFATLVACQQNPTSLPTSNTNSQTGDTTVTTEVGPNEQQMQNESSSNKKKIKVALLLDTSGSMQGLIEQAKTQLWKIVMQLAKAKDPEGKDPEIEIALYQYGNDGLSVYDSYVEKISGFTSELDDISEKLFALRTNGGEEYCGAVISKSLDQLEWSSNSGDLQMIFIAGNEPFSQGGVQYSKACGNAAMKDVVVNTIFCGNYHEGISTFWQDGATIGQGKYMNIDHNERIVHVNSPYDKQISQLNIILNQTYIPYGAVGNAKLKNQTYQDNNASGLSQEVATTRYLSKSSKAYKNTSWDLVDKANSKTFKWEEIREDELPENMKQMNLQERKDYVADNQAKRDSIKTQMAQLGQKREEYVKNERAKMGASNNQLDNAMINAIVEQAERKNYSFEKSIN